MSDWPVPAEHLFRLALALMAVPIAALCAWGAIEAFWALSKFMERR